MEPIKPQSLKQLEKERPGIEVPKGKWRLALLQAGELIEKHGIEYEPAKTEKVLIKAAFAFWQQLFRTKDIAFFKELGDRMDGKSPQAVALTDGDGGKLSVTLVRFSDLPLVGEGSTIAANPTPQRLDS